MNRDIFRLIRLLEILDNAEKLLAVSYEEFRKSPEKSLALSYNCLMVGMISIKISDDLKKRNSHVDWVMFSSFHNLLEEYDNIDYDRLWHVAKNDFPMLKEQIRKILEDISGK